ncbi:MAG: aminotransferase class V-fold PLP-dependent enzyme [Gemmatimonadaceae bacterium]|nr:aminotransferase class V-fold PLP-dependent enzyme [Phycisphaerae bacterium]NUQ10811.1 aminotransferase class V-fold PLP-dependent enzyme [Gemmatimonadaceae bacterium]
MRDRLYLDNAATSFPKPPAVFDAMRDYAERLGASAGRGAYREALETGEIVSRCRRLLARLFNAEAPEQIVFGLNCTDMLNLAIQGAVRPGDHVVASRMDHNSVLRPLKALEATGVSHTLVPADQHTGLIRADDVIGAIRPNTRLVVLHHAGNVSGAIAPIADIGRTARSRDILFLVDAAQTAGHLPIDVRGMSIDLLAFPGHKGLLGPLGTGGLYVRRGIEPRIRPLKQGGTGSVSEEATHPSFMPDRYESGSHNAIGLAGLAAAVEWILDRGVESLAAHDRALSVRFLDGVRDMPDVTVLGPGDPSQRVAVFSVRVGGYEPSELAALLEGEFGLLTRGGIHCAPLAHATFGTHQTGGATRLSFGAFNTECDVDRALDALSQVSAAVAPR